MLKKQSSSQLSSIWEENRALNVENDDASMAAAITEEQKKKKKKAAAAKNQNRNETKW